jgi:DNA-binding PucR family transcriptional regulator
MPGRAAAPTTWQRVRRASPRLSTAAVRRMESLPWFAALSAEQRSWVGLVVQSGLASFAGWFRDTDQTPTADVAIFAAAPREMARAVSLQQTVQLIRATVEVLEEAVPQLAAPGDEALLERAVLRYSREVAFAAAEVYAAAAEERGAWDARLEASVVEALARGDVGEAVQSRAASLGWGRPQWVLAVAGEAPASAADSAVAELRTAARHTSLSLLVGDHGGQLLVVVGGTGGRSAALKQVVAAFGAGPVVTGPVEEDLVAAAGSVREALAGLAAVAAWPGAPRPVAADALLAERVVLGDPDARRRLLEEVYDPLAAAGGDLMDTVAAYLDAGGSVEATARALFLHPNTVRYRLKKVAALVGLDLSQPRDAQVTRVSLTLGRTSVL